MPNPQNKNNFWQIKALAEADTVEILLYGDIGDDYWSDNNAIDLAMQLNHVTAKTINVRVNSPGGSVWAAQAMYNCLKNHPATVNVYIDGIAASAATLVSMAGDRITMPVNSVMMIHNPMISAYGVNHKDLAALANCLEAARETMIAVYAAKSGLDRERLIEIMDAETYLSASAAKEMGFADEVNDFKIAASLDGDKLIVGGVAFDRGLVAKLGIPEAALIGEAAQAAERAPEHKNAAAAAKNEGRDNHMTLEELKAQHPDTFAAIMAAGKEEGVKAERNRLLAIDEVAMPGYEEMTATARTSGTTAAELAMQIVASEKARAASDLNARSSDARELAGEISGVDTGSGDPVADRHAAADAEELKAILAVASATAAAVRGKHK